MKKERKKIINALYYVLFAIQPTETHEKQDKLDMHNFKQACKN